MLVFEKSYSEVNYACRRMYCYMNDGHIPVTAEDEGTNKVALAHIQSFTRSGTLTTSKRVFEHVW